MTGLVLFDPTKRVRIGPLPPERLRLAGESEVQLRLQQIRSVLGSFGITDLSTLGELRLSGTLVPQPGLTRPSTSLPRPPIAVSGFRFDRRLDAFVAIGASAQLVAAEPLPKPVSSPPRRRSRTRPGAGFPRPGLRLDLDIAYWAATFIRLVAGSTVVLKYPHTSLVIIADKIIVEDDVTISWQRPQLQQPAAPARPGPPADRPAATSTAKPPPGERGREGAPGGPGANGFDAPSIEMWTLAMTGRPVIDLAGADGGDGGDGGRGGRGAQGSRERRGAFVFLEWCEEGPGNGGDGGRGGRGGDGGPGGTGGNGGRFSLFAPQPVLTQFQQNLAIAINGGAGGAGGQPGLPGDGGQSGQARARTTANPMRRVGAATPAASVYGGHPDPTDPPVHWGCCPCGPSSRTTSGVS